MGDHEHPEPLPLNLKKDKVTVVRNALTLLVAKANDYFCTLYFEGGEKLQYGYHLKKLQAYVAASNQFARVHRSYLIKLSAVVGYVYRKAKLINGDLIPLNAAGYELVKLELASRTG